MANDKICCYTLNDIIESVALEEAAISHILNAEGEKIQKAVEKAVCIDDLLKVNCSVQNTISNITNLECVLFNKLRAVLKADCKECPLPPTEKGAISICVYSCDSKQPLSGIGIQVFDKHSALVGSGVTDANGKFLIDNLQNGIYTVVLKDPVTGAEKTFTATITDTQKIVIKQLCFERPEKTGLCLYVFECQCKYPLQNIEVKLYDNHNILIDHSVTDSKGKYKKLDLPFGTYRLQLTNHETMEVKEIFVEINAQHRFVEVEECFINSKILEGVIKVRVFVCGTTRPLDCIEVIVKDHLGSIVTSGLTDSNGCFTTEHLPFATYIVEIIDSATSKTEIRTVILSNSQKIVEIDVCFKRCVNNLVNISGVVTDECGKPICNARVVAQGLNKMQALTNNEGHYSLSSLKVCSQFSIYAECNGHSSVAFVNSNPVKKNYVYNIQIKM
ncbi:MAG: SpaA isopeptide-forming pilin-related protein [Clostridia bacterium]